MARREAQAGFTLVEALVALALFALIAIAGLGVLGGVLRARSHTDARLEALAELDRAGYLMTLDIEQLADGVLLHQGAQLSLRRLAPGQPDGALLVRYELSEDALHRTVGGLLSRERREQVLARGIARLGWRFLDPATGWTGVWPPDGAQTGALPRALSVELDMLPGRPGPGGTYRRVFRLPDRP